VLYCYGKLKFTSTIWEKKRLTERFEKFSFAISELYHYLHKITHDEMEEYGLKGPHAIYFFVLSHNKEGLTCAEISEASFRDKADVSRAMTLFEKKGLVTKKGGTNSSYRAKIVLTKDGFTAATKLRERAKVVTDAVGNGLDDENRSILYEGLEIIASNMRGICSEKLTGNTKTDSL